jgi:predicted RNA-binding protein associated with RNAse of E/G family
MYLQIRNPNPVDLRVGDLLYDLANDLQWLITNNNLDMKYFDMIFKERSLVVPYDRSTNLESYILIREVILNA